MEQKSKKSRREGRSVEFLGKRGKVKSVWRKKRREALSGEERKVKSRREGKGVEYKRIISQLATKGKKTSCSGTARNSRK